MLHHFPHYYSHLEAVFMYCIKNITMNDDIVFHDMHININIRKGRLENGDFIFS